MSVLRCDVRHDILQERGLLRFGEETERHRPLFRKPDYRDVIFLDVRNNLTAALPNLVRRSNQLGWKGGWVGLITVGKKQRIR